MYFLKKWISLSLLLLILIIVIVIIGYIKNSYKRRSLEPISVFNRINDYLNIKTGTTLEKQHQALVKEPNRGTTQSSADSTNHRCQATYSLATDDGNQRRRLPCCIILGVRKAGTRALLEYMGMHPSIAIATKEITYFNNDQHFKKGLTWYRNQMPLSTELQITIEKTPSYYDSKWAAKRIHRFNETIKLIVIVRDPVIRAISEYTQKGLLDGKAKGKTFQDLAFDPLTGNINDSYNAIRTSQYARMLPTWFKYFRFPHQLHLVDGDALIQNPLPEMRKVEEFLGLCRFYSEDVLYFDEEKGFYCYVKADGERHCLGESKGRKHPDVPDWLIDKLTQYYRPHNARFYRMVNRTFSWPYDED